MERLAASVPHFLKCHKQKMRHFIFLPTTWGASKFKLQLLRRAFCKHRWCNWKKKLSYWWVRIGDVWLNGHEDNSGLCLYRLHIFPCTVLQTNNNYIATALFEQYGHIPFQRNMVTLQMVIYLEENNININITVQCIYIAPFPVMSNGVLQTRELKQFRTICCPYNCRNGIIKPCLLDFDFNVYKALTSFPVNNSPDRINKAIDKMEISHTFVITQRSFFMINCS